MKPVVIVQHDVNDPPGLLQGALRESRMPCETRRLDLGDALPVWPDEASALISLGGAMHPHQTTEHPFLADEITLMRRMLHQGAPVWGICLGAQLLTLAAGGRVYERSEPELGWVSIAKAADDPLLRGVPSPFTAFCWHLYSCELPPAASLAADGDDGVQAYRIGDCAWATQFHPEVDASMMPHWIDHVAAKHPERGPGFEARLRADTERWLPAYPRFCGALTRNFLRAGGLRGG